MNGNVVLLAKIVGCQESYHAKRIPPRSSRQRPSFNNVILSTQNYVTINTWSSFATTVPFNVHHNATLSSSSPCHPLPPPTPHRSLPSPRSSPPGGGGGGGSPITECHVNGHRHHIIPARHVTTHGSPRPTPRYNGHNAIIRITKQHHRTPLSVIIRVINGTNGRKLSCPCLNSQHSVTSR